MEIGAANSARIDFDQHVVGFNLWFRNFLVFELARCFVNECFHLIREDTGAPSRPHTPGTESMFAHVICGIRKRRLNRSLSVCRQLERSAKSAPESTHFRDIRHDLALFDAVFHLSSRGSICSISRANETSEGIPIGFASFIALIPCSGYR